MTEYVIAGGIIAIASVFTVWLFGRFVLAVFGMLSEAMKDDEGATPSWASAESVIQEIEAEAEEVPDMKDFDEHVEDISP